MLKTGTRPPGNRRPRAENRRPDRITRLPISYEHAFGGLLLIPLSDEKSAKRVPKKYRLPLERRRELGLPEPLAAYSRSESNPVGVGFAERWAIKTLKIKSLPAPQIKDPDHPVTAKRFWKALEGKKAALAHPALQPVGFGAMGRSWHPRRALAGTYDDAWLEKRHPLLPKDFDFAYWNCAHPNLQCEHLQGNEFLTLQNMATPTTSGLSQDKAGNRYLRVALPGHTAFVLARFENGTVGTIPLKLDTLIVDMPAMQITQVWRATIMRTHPLRMLELRMKLNRNALPTSMVIYQKEPGE